MQIPKIGYMKMLIPLPRFKKSIHKFDGEHYWEIGKDGYPLSKITKDIKRAGFDIKKTYRIFENPYHRFFVLKKRNNSMKRIRIFIKRIIPGTYYRKISNLYNYLRLLFLFGFKYKCIFCKGHFRKLLPIGLKNDVAMNLIGGISL